MGRRNGSVHLPTLYGSVHLPTLYGSVHLPTLYGSVHLPTLYGSVHLPNPRRIRTPANPIRICTPAKPYTDPYTCQPNTDPYTCQPYMGAPPAFITTSDNMSAAASYPPAATRVFGRRAEARTQCEETLVIWPRHTGEYWTSARGNEIRGQGNGQMMWKKLSPFVSRTPVGSSLNVAAN
jgi:hypothetical protein